MLPKVLESNEILIRDKQLSNQELDIQLRLHKGYYILQ